MGEIHHFVAGYLLQVKSDEHMAKVKEQLMFEQRAIEQAEERYALICFLHISSLVCR
jgi:hypothetical protein